MSCDQSSVALRATGKGTFELSLLIMLGARHGITWSILLNRGGPSNSTVTSFSTGTSFLFTNHVPESLLNGSSQEPSALLQQRPRPSPFLHSPRSDLPPRRSCLTPTCEIMAILTECRNSQNYSNQWVTFMLVPFQFDSLIWKGKLRNKN